MKKAGGNLGGNQILGPHTTTTARFRGCSVFYSLEIRLSSLFSLPLSWAAPRHLLCFPVGLPSTTYSLGGSASATSDSFKLPYRFSCRTQPDSPASQCFPLKPRAPTSSQCFPQQPRSLQCFPQFRSRKLCRISVSQRAARAAQPLLFASVSAQWRSMLYPSCSGRSRP